MSVARDLIIDQLPSGDDGDKHLATWYTQGHSDGLGDRLLMFDNTSAPSWEILRFKPALARDERFEAALRDRMDQLASFGHHAFPLVRPLKGLGHEDGLAVVSTYSPGLPLAEAMKRPRSAGFAARLLRQLAPALAALQQHGRGLFHGALDADRVVVTATGRLTIREHMVGSALASLELPADRLWTDFHVLAAPGTTGAPVLDQRTDVVQLGLVVLSLMAGRRIGPDEYPEKIEGLLDEIAERNGRQTMVFFRSLRYWLERALQLDEFMFDTARDASDALSELREEPEQAAADFAASVGAALPGGPESALALEDGQAWPRPRLVTTTRADETEGVSAPVVTVVDAPVAAVIEQSTAQAVASPTAAATSLLAARRLGRPVHWLAGAVGALALVEAVFIGRLLWAKTFTPPPTPPVVIHDAPMALAPTSGVAEPESRTAESAARPEARLPIVSPKNGGFRLTSPIEVHVLDNDRLLGSSSDGPIVAAAGKHEFEFVNSALGFRTRRVVEIKAGQIAAVSVAMPNGTLNVNAVPWAAVWIDGNSIGDTPIGNLTIPVGEHDLLFRHPQLGERREKITVRADGPTRVTVNLQR